MQAGGRSVGKEGEATPWAASWQEGDLPGAEELRGDGEGRTGWIRRGAGGRWRNVAPGAPALCQTLMQTMLLARRGSSGT